MEEAVSKPTSMLNRKKGSIKSRLTKFKTYLDSLEIPLSENVEHQLRLRTDKISTLQDEFNQIMSEQECAEADDEVLQKLYEERDDFEDEFYEAVARAKSMLSRASSVCDDDQASFQSLHPSGHNQNKMKSFLVLCLLATLCGALAKNKKSEDKVKIAVYYESLCPDSKKFITEQLAPVWRDFRGVVKVKLVPYGKSTHDKVNGKWQFNCHHGPDECYGNKVQSCILKDRNLQDTEKMELVICLMGQAQPDKSLDTCLAQVKKETESAKLKRCADGDQGDTLLATYGDKTDGVQRPLGFVPTIVINEKFDQANQDEAFANLKAVVCRVAVNKPSIC